jgi:hypothetical protein
MNAANASARLAIPYRRLIRYLEDGAIRGEREGKEWFIEDAEVERVRAAREQAADVIAPELAAAETLVAMIGDVRGRAMRDAATHAREIVQLADAWDARAAGGAAPVMSEELANTLARHIANIATIAEVLRGTAATYKAIRDHLAGIARLKDATKEPV